MFDPTSGGSQLQGWEARRQAEIRRAAEFGGQADYLRGGAYDPTNRANLYKQALGANYFNMNQMPQANVPGVDSQMSNRAMGMAGQAAGLQSGIAAQALGQRGGLSPAALQAMLAGITQQGAGSMMQAGVEGMGMDVQRAQMIAELQQRQQLANMQAVSQQNTGIGDIMGQGWQQGAQASGDIANAHRDMITAYWDQRRQNQQAKDQQWQQAAYGVAKLGANFIPGIGPAVSAAMPSYQQGVSMGQSQVGTNPGLGYTPMSEQIPQYIPFGW